MAITTYTAIREFIFDQTRTCGNCGHSYVMLWRTFGAGEDSVLFSAKAAQRRAHQRAGEAGVEAEAIGRKTAIIAWQRCPKCGLYSQEESERIAAAYPALRRGMRQRFFLVGVGGLSLLFGTLALVAAVVDTSPNRPALAVLISLGVPFTLGGGLVLWAGLWLGSRSRFQRRVASLNEPKRVRKWLRNWAKRGAPLQAKILAGRHGPDVWRYDELNFYRYLRDACPSPALVDLHDTHTG